jgi:hypothetical protein
MEDERRELEAVGAVTEEETEEVVQVRLRPESPGSEPSALARRSAKARLGLVLVMMPLPADPCLVKLVSALRVTLPSVLSEHVSLASDW